MTIEDFFRLLLRNALLISLLTLLGLAGGYAFSYTKPTVYEATALGYVTARVETDANGQEIPMGGSVPAAGGDAEKYGTAQTYLPLFNTPTVGQAVIDDLGLQGTSAHAIASNLTASIDPNVSDHHREGARLLPAASPGDREFVHHRREPRGRVPAHR